MRRVVNMPKTSENNFGYMFNNVFYDENILNQLEAFNEEYADKTDAELYAAIEEAQANVDNEVKKKHIKNLELMAQMEGFVSENTVRNINNVKQLIKIDETSTKSRRYSRRRIDSQFFAAGSLLLWFLLVAVLFRGSRFRGPYGYPYRPY